jgi:hypothetical protein
LPDCKRFSRLKQAHRDARKIGHSANGGSKTVGA